MAVIKRETLEELRSAGIDTIPRLFRYRAENWPDVVVMREKIRGVWKEITWQTYGARVRQISLALQQLGFEKGDRAAIISENRPEWLYCDQGIMAAAGVSVGIYTTDSPRQIAYIVNNCQPRYYFAENEEQLDKILEVRDRTPSIEKIIVFNMKGLRDFNDPGVISFEAFLEIGRKAVETGAGAYDARLEEVSPADLAILVYTSGTTGPPKGVMLSNANIMAGMFVFFDVDPPKPGRQDELLNYLPLCHVAERNISGFGPLSSGTIINFAESMATVPQDIREVSPTYFLAVPRIWEKFYSSLMLRLKDSTSMEKLTCNWAQSLGQRIAEYRLKDRTPPLWLRILYWLGDLLILQNLKRSIGLDRARLCLSGAAPISPDLLKFYYGLGIDMREVYGQTESCGLGTIHYEGRTKFGTIGEPMPGIEIRIADDGEILMKGPNVFMGYWGSPQKTGDTISDGWLLTGDVGKIDEDGHLVILDRKKDIIITAGGKNITPTEIENQLKFSPYINDAVVIGDRRKYLTALIMIDEENVMNYAQENRIPFTTFASLTRDEDVIRLIQKEVDQVNNQLARAEAIKKFSLIDILLTTDDEEITATGKLKRNFVSERFKDRIESMY